MPITVPLGLVIAITITILVNKFKYSKTLENKTGKAMIIIGVWLQPFSTILLTNFLLVDSISPLSAEVLCVILSLVLAIIGLVLCITSKRTMKNEKKITKTNAPDLTDILD